MHKTLRQFEAALKAFDKKEAKSHCQDAKRARRAAFAAFWFIENVTYDDPSASNIFFEVRGIVRELFPVAAAPSASVRAEAPQ